MCATSQSLKPRISRRVEHTNLDKKAYVILKTMIVQRELEPGSKIPQERIAADLGISRTPLINALKLLEKEHLVEPRPRRGFYVRVFDLDEMLAVFELREVLEGLACRKAAEAITPEQIKRLRTFFAAFAELTTITDVKAYAEEDKAFHAFLIEIGANTFLSSILETYNIIKASYQSVATEGLIRKPGETIGEHIAIIDAICQRNASEAERLMRIHLSNSIAALRQRGTAKIANPAK